MVDSLNGFRVLVVVNGGIADYIADHGIEVCVFDVDNWEQASSDEKQYMIESLKGFESITPDWINDLIEDNE